MTMGTQGLDVLLPYLTGSGGALIVLLCWVLSLRATNATLRLELNEISREAVACITQILAREDHQREWRDRVIDLLTKIEERTRRN